MHWIHGWTSTKCCQISRHSHCSHVETTGHHVESKTIESNECSFVDRRSFFFLLKAGRLPGQCFPFKGDQGSVIIKLAVPVKPTEFVLEHLSKSISIVGHISSAPKNFTVTVSRNFSLRIANWTSLHLLQALKDKNDQEGRVLGRYFYDAENGPSLQRFAPQVNFWLFLSSVISHRCNFF